MNPENVTPQVETPLTPQRPAHIWKRPVITTIDIKRTLSGTAGSRLDAGSVATSNNHTKP
jgi:hypothetical protein